MIVGELITELQRFDENLEVQADWGMSEYKIESVDLAEGSSDDDEQPVVVLDLYPAYE